MSFEENFLALGNEIPPVTPSIQAGCNFILYKQVGNLLMLSCYVPFWGADLPDQYKGKQRKEISNRIGYHASQFSGIT